MEPDDRPLGYPSVRVWELDGDSSWYDRMRAAPSDEHLRYMWIGYSILFGLFTLFNFLVFLSVALLRKTRRNPFNQYLLALMVPDVSYTGICAVQCLKLAISNGYAHSFECLFQSFYLAWAVSSNSWLNGVVAFQIHRLLRHSHRRRRYFPPTTRSVALQALAVYLFAAFIASWGVLPYPNLPHKTDSNHGLVCIPIDYDWKSTLFFWLVFYPLLSAIPLVYVVWVTIDVTRNGLLPPQGKKREIAVFFFRVVMVFVAMWLPSLLILYTVNNEWVVYAAGIWAHSQGAVSAGVSMLKADIRLAVWDFLNCRTWSLNRQLDDLRPSMSSQSWNSTRSGISAQSWNLSNRSLIPNLSNRSLNPNLTNRSLNPRSVRGLMSNMEVEAIEEGDEPTTTRHNDDEFTVETHVLDMEKNPVFDKRYTKEYPESLLSSGFDPSSEMFEEMEIDDYPNCVAEGCIYPSLKDSEQADGDAVPLEVELTPFERNTDGNEEGSAGSHERLQLDESPEDPDDIESRSTT